MKLEFTLQGLDCGNCATKIERKLKKVNMIQEVSVNFMTSKLSLVLLEDSPEILEKITSIIHKVDAHITLKRR